MDEPFYFANLYKGAGACQWSAQQIATNALTSLNILKAAFPGLIIGDTEPMSGNGQAPDWLQRYAAWMDTFQAVTGSKLAFFHSDTILTIPTWMSDIVSVRTQTSELGILLGIIYDGFPSDSSDAQWTSRVTLP